MLNFINRFFKRKPKREYLYDEFSPKKSSLVVWLQRLILLLVLIIISSFILSINSLANASEYDSNSDYININEVKQGSLLLNTSHAQYFKPLPLLSTDVDMYVSGMLVRSHVKQRFKNTGNNRIEAIYVFPLPETASVDHMRMHIGERIIEGQIKEKQAAKKIYKQAMREGRKASLVEQERPNLFTNSVANIEAGETVVIEIEYQQVLEYNQGDFSLRFPMAITPRYIPGIPVNESVSIQGNGWAQNTSQVADASRITPPVLLPSDANNLNAFFQDNLAQKKMNSVALNIHLDAGFPLQKLFSRYHSINHRKISEQKHLVTLTSDRVPAERDFELVWTPDAGYSPKAAVFNETIDNENYQLLMMLPPQSQIDNDQPLARDITYIIDTSGSMHGTSMGQAKNSLLIALDRLRLHDRFNIIQFNSATDALFHEPQMASFENVLQAKSYVNQLQANGGTEMAPALRRAFNHSENDNYIQQIIFLTDGSVGNEAELFDLINQHLGQRRLFTVGIGSAPNSYFMRKAAQFGRGTFTYISDVNEVSEKMTALFKKLESPLMTNLNIDFEHSLNAETWPQRIPDLYSGEPLIIAIKTDTQPGHITLTGTRALTDWSASVNMAQGKSSKGIATFWARNKMASLMDSLHNNDNKSAIRKEVTDIALKHHLVSQYTSLVAVDITPVQTPHTPAEKHVIPANLPYGQSFSAADNRTYGRLPQTASNARVQFFFGCSLLILGLLSQLIHQPSCRKKLQQWRLM